MFKKAIRSAVICAGLLAVPVLVNAGSALTIVNNTNQPSTSVINGGACSSKIPIPGLKGVTDPHSTNVIAAPLVGLVCNHKSPCFADVYMTDNCSNGGANPVIATIVLDLNSGIQSVTMKDASSYSISYSGFTVTMDGGTQKLAAK